MVIDRNMFAKNSLEECKSFPFYYQPIYKESYKSF